MIASVLVPECCDTSRFLVRGVRDREVSVIVPSAHDSACEVEFHIFQSRSGTITPT